MSKLLADSEFHIQSARFTVLKPYQLAKPFQDSGMGPFTSFGFAVLTLTDADGVLAEVPLSPGAGPVLESLFLPRLLTVGPVRYNALFRLLYWAMRNEGFRSPHVAGPLGSIDLALHGLVASRAGLPLHQFLGATRNWAGVYACGGGTNLTDTELVAEAAGFAEQGYDLFKMKVGRQGGTDILGDVARVRAVRRALGPGVGLAVDANQIWSVAEALAFLQHVDDLELSWIEEPIHAADLVGLRALCAASVVPVGVGESEVCGLVFPALADAGATHLQPQPMHLASVAEWLDTRDLAQERGLALSAGGFSHWVASLVATAPETAHTELLSSIIGPMADYFLAGPVRQGNRFLLPLEPGLPVRFNWERIARMGQIWSQKTWTSADFGPLQHLVV